MDEAFRNVAVLVWALCAINNDSYAGENLVIAEENHASASTIVYGSAATPSGGRDETVVEQPEGTPNPLGNPIPDENSANNADVSDEPAVPVSEAKSVVKTSPAEQPGAFPQPEAPLNSQQLGKDFQNTLMEANGMVYDVQAYPVEDFDAIGNPSNPQTIYSPNVNP